VVYFSELEFVDLKRILGLENTTKSNEKGVLY
jgi:hypothetical protein